MGLNMQRFLALEQVSVVLASCQPFFRRTYLVMTARILLKPCSAYLFAIGAHGLRPVLDETILLKPCSAYLSAIGAHGLRHTIGDLSRIRDIAKRYPLSRAAPYKIKKKCSHPFLCEHKWMESLFFNFARLKPNVHIYTVSLPSGDLLLPGIVRLGVRCLF